MHYRKCPVLPIPSSRFAAERHQPGRCKDSTGSTNARTFRGASLKRVTAFGLEARPSSRSGGMT